MDQNIMLDDRNDIHAQLSTDDLLKLIFQHLERYMRRWYDQNKNNLAALDERAQWKKNQWVDLGIDLVNKGITWKTDLKRLGDWQSILRDVIGENHDIIKKQNAAYFKDVYWLPADLKKNHSRVTLNVQPFARHRLEAVADLDLERSEAVEIPDPEAPESLGVRPADNRKAGEEGGEFVPEKAGPEYDPASDSARIFGSGPFDTASNIARNVLTPGVVEYAKKTIPGYLLDAAVTGGLPRLGDEIDRAGKNVQAGVDTVLDAKLPSLREGAQLLQKVAEQTADPIKTFNENISFRNTNTFLDKFIPVQYSDSAFRFLQKYGETMVTRVKVRRAPIAKGLEKAFQLISQGNWEAGKKAAGYDSMFHLSLIANGNLFFEKLSKIHLDDKVDKVPMSEYWEVAVPVPMSVNTMLERTRRVEDGGLGDERYFKYDPFVNNCQQFVRRMLLVNGLLTPELEAWVVQPTEKILEQNPEYLSSFSLLLTNTGALLGLGVATRNGINFKKRMTGGKKDLEEKVEIQKSNPNVLQMLDEFPDLDDIDMSQIQSPPASPVPPPIPALQINNNNRAPESLPSTPGVGSGKSGLMGGRRDISESNDREDPSLFLNDDEEVEEEVEQYEEVEVDPEILRIQEIERLAALENQSRRDYTVRYIERHLPRDSEIRLNDEDMETLYHWVLSTLNLTIDEDGQGFQGAIDYDTIEEAQTRRSFLVEMKDYFDLAVTAIGTKRRQQGPSRKRRRSEDLVEDNS